MEGLLLICSSGWWCFDSPVTPGCCQGVNQQCLHSKCGILRFTLCEATFVPGGIRGLGLHHSVTVVVEGQEEVVKGCVCKVSSEEPRGEGFV